MSVTVKSLDVDHSDRSLEHVCKEGTHGLLLWIRSNNFANVPELDTGLKYVGRAAFDEEFSGFCTYDPSTEVCSNGDGEMVSHNDYAGYHHVILLTFTLTH